MTLYVPAGGTSFLATSRFARKRIGSSRAGLRESARAFGWPPALYFFLPEPDPGFFVPPPFFDPAVVFLPVFPVFGGLGTLDRTPNLGLASVRCGGLFRHTSVRKGC